tara:strand:+ start:723 stop:1004 length:282 start_codon:yes stop_codon:yes gene_type:complete
LKEIIFAPNDIKKKKGIINKPPIVGVLFLIKCELGPSVLIVCKILYFLINLIPYFVETVHVISEKIYKKKMEGLFVYIEFIKVINEIIINRIL